MNGPAVLLPRMQRYLKSQLQPVAEQGTEEKIREVNAAVYTNIVPISSPRAIISMVW